VVAGSIHKTFENILTRRKFVMKQIRLVSMSLAVVLILCGSLVMAEQPTEKCAQGKCPPGMNCVPCPTNSGCCAQLGNPDGACKNLTQAKGTDRPMTAKPAVAGKTATTGAASVSAKSGCAASAGCVPTPGCCGSKGGATKTSDTKTDVKSDI